ncbi:MAG: choice-of-anchor D domain-containing protein [Acidobacteriota bacterium]
MYSGCKIEMINEGAIFFRPLTDTKNPVELTGEQPRIAINLTSVNFGKVAQNAAASEMVFIKNIGKQALVISAITPPEAPFLLDKVPLPLTLQPGEKTRLMIRLRPVATGFQSSVLRIKSNDPTKSFHSLVIDAEIVKPRHGFYEAKTGDPQRDFGNLNRTRDSYQRTPNYAVEKITTRESPRPKKRLLILSVILILSFIGILIYQMSDSPKASATPQTAVPQPPKVVSSALCPALMK